MMGTSSYIYYWNDLLSSSSEQRKLLIVFQPLSFITLSLIADIAFSYSSSFSIGFEDVGFTPEGSSIKSWLNSEVNEDAGKN